MKDFKKIKETIDFAIQEKITKKYNDEMVKKTWYYQKKFNFETNPKRVTNFGMLKLMLLNTLLVVLIYVLNMETSEAHF